MIGSDSTASPTAHGMAMRLMVRTADSSVCRAPAVLLLVSAAVTVGMIEIVMGVMSEHGRLKIVWQKL